MGRDRSRSQGSDKSSSRSRSFSSGGGRSRSRRRERSRSKNRARRSRSHSSDNDGDLLKLYWKPLKEDSRNFDAWTQLLQYVEQMNETKSARVAYDEFLKRYPYCYGYWRKYAEFERRHKHLDRCVEVYERGVTAVQLSVDLWIHYIAFVKEMVNHQENAVQKTRSIYERAIEACGLEFRSDKLWEEFIHWELHNGETVRVGALYDNLLSTPTLLYSNHFEKYQNFVNSYEPDRVIDQDEYNEVFAKIETMLPKTIDGDLYIIEECIDDSPPDFIAESGEEPPPKMVAKRRHREDALRALRHEIIERRRNKHLANEQEVSRRWAFEENVKRPYFHVKPLERAQLQNWLNYLDYEIERNDAHRIVILFERCLIACALYEEMWIKFARYFENIGEMARARIVYRRAVEVHVPRKPNVHLAYSAFEEKHGDFETANTILADFDRRYPGYAVIALRRIGIERRYAVKQSGEKGTTDYSSVISRFERLIHDTHTPRKLSTFYALKLARFHAKSRNDRRLAEKIIRDAITRDKTNPHLYLALVDLAFTSLTFNEKHIIEALDEVLGTEHLSEEDKLRFSQRKLDFMEDLGTDIEALQVHLEYHTRLQKAIESDQSANKRRADDKASGDSSEKRTRMNSQYNSGYAVHQQSQQHQQYYASSAVATDNGALAYANVAPHLISNPSPYYQGASQAIQPVLMMSGGIQSGYPGQQ